MALPKIREQIEARVKDTGDTMTGLLTLSGNPTADFHAATKKYVDDNTGSKLTTDAGSSTLPVYFEDGVPKECNTNLGVSITGNAATATKATQDGNGANIASTYLKLSGGTMTGPITMNAQTGLIMKFNGGADNPFMVLSEYPEFGIRYHEGSPDKMTFSASGNATTPSSADLCINGNGEGTVTVRGNTILHAGNYNSYAPTKTGGGASGTWGISISGNAATATRASQDGSGNNIYDNYEKRYRAVIDLTSLNVDTWYPVVSRLSYNGMHRVACVCQLNTGSVPSWSNHASGFTAVLEMMTVASGWGTTSAHTICLSNDQRHILDTSKPPVGFKQFTNSSSACFYCRGGGKYILETDYITTWTYYTTSTTVSGEAIAPVTTYPGVGNINGTTYHYLQSPVNSDYTTYRARNIASNTSTLTSGSSGLSNGYIYLQYK